MIATLALHTPHTAFRTLHCPLRILHHALGRLLAAFDAIRNADAAIGVAGQREMRDCRGPRFDLPHQLQMPYVILGHHPGPTRYLAKFRFAAETDQLAEL